MGAELKETNDVKDVASGTSADKPAGLTINDVDMSRGFHPINAALKGDDHIPRPPYDPLTTGNKIAGVADSVASLVGGYRALSKYHGEGLHVLRSDIVNLDRLVGSPQLAEYKNLGSSVQRDVNGLKESAHRDLVNLQEAKPHLFESTSGGNVWKGVTIRTPKYDLLNASERAMVERADNLKFISSSLERGVNTSSTANFKSGLNVVRDLHRNPTAIEEGLSPALRRLEDLGGTVSEQAATSTVNMASESRALMAKNVGIVAAALGTNYLIEKTLLKNSAPGPMTMVTDFVSPSIILTELPLWAKFGVMVGAHAVSRFAEYGPNSYKHD